MVPTVRGESTGNHGQPRHRYQLTKSILIVSAFNHHLVTRGYSWLLVKELHLFEVNNRYSRLN